MGFNIVKLTDPINLTNIVGGLTPKGAYNGATDYAVGDSVDYQGSSYVMFVDAAAGTLPTDTTKWQVIANKGATGAAGADGAAGAVGPQGPAGAAGADGADGIGITPQAVGFTLAGGTIPKTLTVALDADVSGTNTGDNAVNSNYSGLVTNANHTGDATGSGALSVVKIQGTAIPAPVAGDDQKVIKYNHATTAFIYDTVSAGGIADPGSNGILARTALNTTSARTLTGTSNQITVTNGDGVSGNPTFSTPQDIHTGATPTFSEMILGSNGLRTANSGSLTRISGGTVNDGAVLILGGSTNGTLPNIGVGRIGGTEVFRWSSSGLQTSNHLSPIADSTYTNGTSSLYWSNTYTDRLYLNATSYLDGSSAGVAQIAGNLVPITNDVSVLGSPNFRWNSLNTNAANLYRVTANDFSNGYQVFKRGTTGDDTAGVANGAEVGYHTFNAWDGTSTYKRIAYVMVRADGATTPTTGGGNYRINVRDSAGTEGDRLFINSVGTTIGSNAIPTHTLTLPSTSTGIALYNTADQTTNYERTLIRYSSNVFEIVGGLGGTGGGRDMTLATAAGNSMTLSGAQSTNGMVYIARSSLTSGTSGILGMNVGLNATSGTQFGIKIFPTIGQSSTAGYTALLINPTETTTGSGAKNLIDAQVGSVSKFKVDNTGKITTPLAQTYSATNVTTDRAYDANATTIDEVADVLGTLIADLRALGLVL